MGQFISEGVSGALQSNLLLKARLTWGYIKQFRDLSSWILKTSKSRQSLHSITGQPDCPHGERVFSYIYLEPLLFPLILIDSCPPTTCCCEEFGSVLLVTILQVLASCYQLPQNHLSSRPGKSIFLCFSSQGKFFSSQTSSCPPH